MNYFIPGIFMLLIFYVVSNYLSKGMPYLDFYLMESTHLRMRR